MNSGLVCSIGHFDGVHRGHQHVIRRMKELAVQHGLHGTVAVTFDRHPRTLFDDTFVPQMLTTVEERTHLLSLAGVDECYVLRFDREMAAMTAREFMEKILRDKLGVRILLLGYDNRFGRRNSAEGFDDYVRYGKELGIEVLACDELKGEEQQRISSTVIRQLLSNGKVDAAMEYLGHPYTMEGTVVSGFQEGRKLGFPTANLDVPPQKLIPASGVYAVKVRVEGSMTSYHGMTNIGHRPTYGENALTLETHIFHFSENIYGKRIQIEFYKRLRSEQQFESVDQLAQQLKHDAKEAEQALA